LTTKGACVVGDAANGKIVGDYLLKFDGEGTK